MRRMGLGWQVLEQGGRTFVIDGGGTGGFRTWMVFDPDRRYQLSVRPAGSSWSARFDWCRLAAPSV